jgi:hypothetical protein
MLRLFYIFIFLIQSNPVHHLALLKSIMSSTWIWLIFLVFLVQFSLLYTSVESVLPHLVLLPCCIKLDIGGIVTRFFFNLFCGQTERKLVSVSWHDISLFSSALTTASLSYVNVSHKIKLSYDMYNLINVRLMILFQLFVWRCFCN